MAELPTELAGALRDYEAGRLPEAEVRLRRMLSAGNRVALIPHILGLIALRTGRAAEAEAQIRQAIAIAPPRPVVVDLCCGSGAVGAALAAALDGAELHAADIDPAAVRCARRNIAPAGGHVYAGDLFEPLPAGLRGRVGILAANVPYVPTAEVGLLPAEARLYEPRGALDGGADGLDVLRRVTAEASRWLAVGGSLLAEVTERQEQQACNTARRGGLVPRVARSAELGATVLIATRPPVEQG